VTDLLTFTPEQSGYDVGHPVQVIATELDGGAPRLRADRIRASGTVSVSWMLDRSEYDQFQNFIIQNTLRGALPFLLDLVTDSFQLARHRCTIVPGSLRTSQVQGFMYRVSAELRAEQLISWMGTFFADNTGVTPNVIKTLAPVSLNLVLGAPTVVQILGLSINDGVHPPITLDGIYGISSFPTGNSIALTTPSVVNPAWITLAGNYPAGPTVGVPNVLLFNSPI
jgi:hypothetical protein